MTKRQNKLPAPEMQALNYFIDLQWFAAEDEGRTETPTEYKLRKAREEGRVAKSAELPAAVSLLLVGIFLLIAEKSVFLKSRELMTFFFQRCTTGEIQGSLFSVFMKYFTVCVLPVAIISCVAIIITYLAQFRGFIFSTKLITPNFSKISPNIFRFFKRAIFSSEGLFNVAKALFKVACVLIIGYVVIRGNLEQLLMLIKTDLVKGVSFIAMLAGYILLYTSILFLVFGVVDYFFQKKQFMESLKMTKQDVKEEFKEQEGDPKIKGQIARRMRELLQKNSIQNVPQADVVITNPTHLAIAFKYDNKTMEAPTVLSKGADLMAQRIKDIAREYDIPIIEDKPLTRAIYAAVEIGDTIPVEYYRAMAEIFKHVYEMDRAKQTAGQK